MLILNATDTLSATAGAATALTVTVYGLEVTSAAQTFKRLYQGQPGNTVTTLYTTPAATQTLVKTIVVANTTGGAQTIAFFQAGTAAANAIVPAISVDAGGMAVYDGTGWIFSTIAGAVKQAVAALAWAVITGTPTTLAGYGITDAYTKTVADGRYDFLGAAAAVTPTTLALVIGTNVQAYNANLTAINQALTATSSPSFTAVTTAVTGHASLDLALAGGTMSGTLAHAGQLVTTPKLQAYTETKTAPAISSNVLTLDLSLSNVFRVACGANITTLTMSNVPATGQLAEFTLILDYSGAYTLTLPGAFHHITGGSAPAVGANSKTDTLTAYTTDGGTTWYYNMAQGATT